MEYRCVAPLCERMFASVYILYVYLYTRARGCVSRFQLKWRFVWFKLAHASRRGLLSDPHIGCCLCVFFIWINWSPVWKILLTNGAGRSWTAAYLLQFVRSIFSQPQPRDDFTQREKKKKIGVVSIRPPAGCWLQPRIHSGPNQEGPAARRTTEMQSVIQTLLNLMQRGGDDEFISTSCECVNGSDFV